MNTESEGRANDKLHFKISPHLVEDLGLNLYTDLPRVLVEFVANAYDADADSVSIVIDKNEIDKARQLFRKQWDVEIEQAIQQSGENTNELASQVLQESLKIIIQDTGIGMSRNDLQQKYLVVGRRRRDSGETRTPKGRMVMGRKGLGKLAGFGVAHSVRVISRTKGAATATSIVLDYDQLLKNRTTDEVVIPDETLSDSTAISPHGTRIELSRLVFEPMKSSLDTITKHLGDYFYGIDPDDFGIFLNDELLETNSRQFVFAWPEPSKPSDELVEYIYETEDRVKITVQYRIRFTGEGQHLPARERGVRVYAHKRLAAAPDLLDLRTGIHGFRNTHYMDAVLVADAIDERKADYIATDRQTLRWETALLAPLRKYLTEKMEEACVEFQKEKDKSAEKDVKDDPFTRAQIADANLPPHRKRLVRKFAAVLAANCEGGMRGKDYKQHLPIFIDGLREGDLFRAISKLANSVSPDLSMVVNKAVELTQHEFGDFIKVLEARISGIVALEKICKNVDFDEKHDENELHKLLEKCPWLIDPTYSHFLTSNETKQTLFDRLEKELQINLYAIADGTDEDVRGATIEERPDLTFVLGNESLRRLVVIELKAPNKPLESKDLDQLLSYMRDASKFLKSKGSTEWKVEGRLIGSIKSKSNAKAIKALLERIESESGPRSAWRVFDLMELLEEASRAHKELKELYEARVSESGEED